MSKKKNQTMMFGFCEALLDEQASPDYGFDGESDVNNLAIRNGDSDTEDEDDEGHVNTQEPEKEEVSYTGRDGSTVWYSNPNQVNTTPRPNVPVVAGVTPHGKTAKTELECWNLFFSNDMLEEILQYTNVEINSRTNENKNARVHIVKETTMDELLAMFGLMYIAGLNNNKGNNLTDLWRSDGTGVDIFRMTMSLQRFNFLQGCLRYDDATTRELRATIDNIASVRMMFDKFIENCQKAYNPSDCLTLDEKYIPFRGDCPFRQFMPNTSASYGIKMYALVDAKNYFTINLEINAGKQPDGPFVVSNEPFDVVDRLIRPVAKTNRNITFDSKFTSVPLVTYLLNEYGLTATGALIKSKKEVPQRFTLTSKRGVNSTLFGFHKDLALVSYMPRKSKIVLLLSSLHQDRSLDFKNGEKPKPEIVSFYEATKSGVEIVDKLSSMYDVRNYCKSWPILILFNMMNVAALNAFIVYQENNNSKVRRCEFIRKLGLALLNQHLAIRKNKDNLPRELRKRLFEQVGETLNDPPVNEGNKPYKRCRDCPSSRDRKTKYSCIECKKPICLQHVYTMCQNCTTLSID